MKKIEKFIKTALFAIVMATSENVYAQTVTELGPVSAGMLSSILGQSLSQHIANGMTAIDTFYQIYDMVTNSITSIENQYKQIQDAIDHAKNINWDDIYFDGDFDIRDDMWRANRKVDSLLNDARSIRDALNTSIIEVPGGGSYSVADLCGRGEGGSNVNIFTAAKDVYQGTKNTFINAARGWAGKLDDSERAAIFQKYGISAANFWMIRQTEDQILNAAEGTIARAADTTQRMENVQKQLSEQNSFIQALDYSRDSHGSITQGAIGEATVRSLNTLSNLLLELKEDINKNAQGAAYQIIKEEKETQARYDALRNEEEIKKAASSSIPSIFAAKAKPINH